MNRHNHLATAIAIFESLALICFAAIFRGSPTSHRLLLPGDPNDVTISVLATPFYFQCTAHLFKIRVMAPGRNTVRSKLLPLHLSFLPRCPGSFSRTWQPLTLNVLCALRNGFQSSKFHVDLIRSALNTLPSPFYYGPLGSSHSWRNMPPCYWEHVSFNHHGCMFACLCNVTIPLILQNYQITL